jgi:hypothetical protein
MRTRLLAQRAVASKPLKNVHKGKFSSKNDIHFSAVCGLFNHAFSILQLRVVGMLVLKNIKGNYLDVIGFTILTFVGGRTEEKHGRTPVRRLNIPVELRTGCYIKQGTITAALSRLYQRILQN